MIAKLLEPYKNRIVYFSGDKTLDYRSLIVSEEDVNLGRVVVPRNRMVIGEQTQSDHIHPAVEKDSGSGFIPGKPRIPIADGFVTQTENLFLCVRSADCVPILLFDPVTVTVGIVHCGREGTRKNAIGAAIRLFSTGFNAQMTDILAVVAPMICEKHYEVDESTFLKFEQDTGVTQNFPCLDLRGTVHQQLLHAGVLDKNIEHQRICTYEDENYFSYRRDGTKNRQIFVIGIYNEQNIRK
ncbi:MAG TPA: polyphenol oxidase family protein [Candidatus Cloacimonadota bacterium]|nr:polyphenol oxidase family protein [Candidatus Cloacimonadota bacterium]HPT71264.1 polyphenol oxidase family protein [Candidatus Cloacimonadota bacterium]